MLLKTIRASAAFLTLAGVAIVGLALYFFVMPETQRRVPVEAEAIGSKAVFAAE